MVNHFKKEDFSRTYYFARVAEGQRRRGKKEGNMEKPTLDRHAELVMEKSVASFSEGRHGGKRRGG
jgi:hypothetical protein